MKRTKKSMLVIFAVLTSLSASASQRTSRQTGLDLIAAEYPTAGALRQPSGNESLLFLSDRPLSSFDNLTYVLNEDGELSVELKIGRDAVAEINRLMALYPEKRLALTHDGEVLFSPSLDGKLKGDSIMLTFKDRASYDRVLSALAGN